jgi:hypothetical protein
MKIQCCKSKSGFLSNNDCRRMRAPGQSQRLWQRDKSIDISLYSGGDELTSMPTRDHDLEHGSSPYAPPQRG